MSGYTISGLFDECDKLRAEVERLKRANLDGDASETRLIEENARLTRERDAQRGRVALVESLAESAADALERAGEIGEAGALRKLLRKDPAP